MKKKILLADDSITIQKVVELTFPRDDYEILCAGDGVQALTMMEEHHPDLLLLDVILPGENGYEVCRRIRSRSDWNDIPIVLLTGTIEPFDRDRARDVGADGHLTKPFESQALVARVVDLLSQPRRVVQAKSTAAESQMDRSVTPGPSPPKRRVSIPIDQPDEPSPPPPQPRAPAVLGQKLSSSELNEIAQRVVKQLSDRVLREVAWEVVPEIAERLVKRRIRQIEEEAG